MKIKVVHVTNGTTQTDTFECEWASRQIDLWGANIIMKNGTDHEGRKVISAQYCHPEVIVTYSD